LGDIRRWVGFVQTVVATSKRKLSFKEQKELENLKLIWPD
jgi:hypothetical protein